MKKQVKSLLLTTVLVTFLISCVSLHDREVTEQEQAAANIIGSITTEYRTHQVFHIINKKSHKSRAYDELMKAARQKYQGYIDVVNIKIEGGASGRMILNGLGQLSGFAVIVLGGIAAIEMPVFLLFTIPGIGIMGLSGNTQKITATGDVILIDSAPGGNTNNVPPPSGNTGNAPAPGGSTGNTPAPGANF